MGTLRLVFHNVFTLFHLGNAKPSLKNIHEEDIKAARDFVGIMRIECKHVLLALVGYSGPEKTFLWDLFFCDDACIRKVLLAARRKLILTMKNEDLNWIDIGLNCTNPKDSAVMALTDFFSSKAVLEEE
jgi:hypothetical protein